MQNLTFIWAQISKPIQRPSLCRPFRPTNHQVRGGPIVSASRHPRVPAAAGDYGGGSRRVAAPAGRRTRSPASVSRHHWFIPPTRSPRSDTVSFQLLNLATSAPITCRPRGARRNDAEAGSRRSANPRAPYVGCSVTVTSDHEAPPLQAFNR